MKASMSGPSWVTLHQLCQILPAARLGAEQESLHHNGDLKSILAAMLPRCGASETCAISPEPRAPASHAQPLLPSSTPSLPLFLWRSAIRRDAEPETVSLTCWGSRGWGFQNGPETGSWGGEHASSAARTAPLRRAPPSGARQQRPRGRALSRLHTCGGCYRPHAGRPGSRAAHTVSPACRQHAQEKQLSSL